MSKLCIVLAGITSVWVSAGIWQITGCFAICILCFAAGAIEAFSHKAVQ